MPLARERERDARAHFAVDGMCVMEKCLRLTNVFYMKLLRMKNSLRKENLYYTCNIEY